MLEFNFESPLIYWRGPAPFYFLEVPAEYSVEIKTVANSVSYGWGMIPVTARIQAVEWSTSMTPKNGKYLLPIKNAIRLPFNFQLGEMVKVNLRLNF